ncbi:MAG: hypothetical protein AABX79_02610 [Nanoarchaeota archaeon]
MPVRLEDSEFVLGKEIGLGKIDIDNRYDPLFTFYPNTKKE